ncbi:MAG: hypothetical protein WCC87_02465 [Candidatus Korobacteraceae bacterium]
MSVSLRSVLPLSSPLAALTALPVCASPFCPRPPTLWQRWWARHEGVWLQDRWYCSPDCFRVGVFRRLEVAAYARRRDPRPNRLPLGLVLLSQGDITASQLREALELQRTAQAGKLGEWLIKLGAVSPQQVITALAVQQGCPVFPAQECQALPAAMHWPDALLQRYRAVPIFFNRIQSSLYVGFLETVSHTWLYSLEQMLRCRTQPCIVPAATYQRQLEWQMRTIESETVMINQRQNSVEMAQTIGNYAQQIHAERCSLTACDDHLWTRLEGSGSFHVDFLFRLPAMS